MKVGFRFLLFLVLGMVACKKQEGKGGKNSIKGTVQAKYYNNELTLYTGQGLALDKPVYLIYGDNIGYGEKTRTNHQGQFEFNYLRAGDYTVYLYSHDLTGTSQSTEKTVVHKVNISGNGVTDLGIIEIIEEDKRKLDKGAYSISGIINQKVCNKSFTYCTGPFPTADIDVFITRLGESAPFERVRSGVDGVYKFIELPSGTYVVYVVGKNPESEINPEVGPFVTISDTVSVTNSAVGGVNFEVID